MVSCICWSPNGDWFLSCSNKDYIGRLWDVTMNGPSQIKSQIHNRNLKLTNGMVCQFKKHQGQICKVLFHTETIIVSCSLDKTIIIWELVRTLNKNNENVMKARVVRRICNTKFY